MNTLATKLRQHEIDFASVGSSTYESLSNVPGIVRRTELRNDVVMLALNLRHLPLQDVRVRQAIAKAIDRRRLIQVVTHGLGTPAYGDLPLFMYDGHPPSGWDERDPAQARALLDAAGWKAGPDGLRGKGVNQLLLHYIAFSKNANGNTADLVIIQMLREVGIDVEYKTFAPSIYYQPASAGGPVSSGNFDIADVASAGGADATDSDLYGCASQSPHGFNSADYCSAEMETLQAAEQLEYDPIRRNQIVAQIEGLAVKDAPYVFLFHTPYRIVCDSNLQRPNASLARQWYGIRDWSFSAP